MKQGTPIGAKASGVCADQNKLLDRIGEGNYHTCEFRREGLFSGVIGGKVLIV